MDRHVRTGYSADDGVQSPGPADALELVFAAIFKGDTRADHEQGHGGRREYLASARVVEDSGRNVDADAADVVAHVVMPPIVGSPQFRSSKLPTGSRQGVDRVEA
jgi:hypothetical protein